MKTTYLIYKDVNADKKDLRVASKQEWDEILKNNRKQSMEHRRCFIRDCIEESDGLDSMFIEVELEEYRKWHSKQVYKEKKRKIGSTFSKVSFDSEVAGSEGCTLSDIISDKVDYENQVINKITMKLLRDSLYQWKPWANEILDLYLDGKDECITRFLCDKLECSEQYSRRLKKEFASIVEKYLKN